MNFKKDIDGFRNECEFSKYLNGRTIKTLNPAFRLLIDDLYGNLDENLVIYSIVNNDMKKFDIEIDIKGVIKRISIKMGIKNSVHVEGISSFIHFLIENSVQREVIVEYLKYHYADGTTNGTGKTRMSIEEYKVLNQDKIDYINREINKSMLLEKAIDRFVLLGINSDKKIDALIYGIVEDFLWINSEDIKKIIMNKMNDYSTAVHFGLLTCQPMNRCLNYNSKYESKRFCVQLKWYNLADDIIENMNSKIVKS